MRKTLPLSCLLALLSLWQLLAVDVTTNAELRTVATALQPVLEKLDPKPEISYSERSPTLVIAYKSQMYKIHGMQKTGEILTNVYDELGPSFKGFVLRVHLEDKGQAHQARTPQTHREPYWHIYIQLTPVKDTDKQLYWNLSYGSRISTNLINQIIGTIEGMKE